MKLTLLTRTCILLSVLSLMWIGCDEETADAPDTLAPQAVSNLVSVTNAPIPGGISLSWTAVGDDGDGGGPAYSYEVRYFSEVITELNWSLASVYLQFWTPLSPGENEARELRGFQQDTVYYFAIKVFDEAGNASPVSNSPSAMAFTPRWTLQFTEGLGNTLFDVWGTGPQNVYAAGSGGTLLHYNGFAWSSFSSGTTEDLYCIWGSSAADIFVGGSNGTLLHYDGSAWAAQSSGTGERISSIWGASGSDVYAVGWNGVNLHYDGTAWSSYGSTYYLSGLWGSSSQNVYAFGGICSVMHHVQIIKHFDGTTWTDVSGPPCCAVWDLWGSADGQMFGVGSRCAASPSTIPNLVHWDGASWTGTLSSPAASLRSVWGTSSSDVYAVGDNGLIMHFDGNAWSSMTSNTVQYLYGVWGSSAADVYAVGTGGTILHYP